MSGKVIGFKVGLSGYQINMSSNMEVIDFCLDMKRDADRTLGLILHMF
jgi:hypothetical protein